MNSEIDVLRKTSSEMIEEIPTQIVPLPSKGKLYPKDHPLHLKEGVEIRDMNAYDENILNSPALIKNGTAINTLIKACLIDKLIDPNSLLIGDKSAIILAIRISGFTEKYKVKVLCSSPDCNHQFPFEFDLSKAVLKPIGTKPLKEGENIFDFELPISKQKILFSLLTDGDDAEIEIIQKRREKLTNSDMDTTITDRLTKAVRQIGSETNPEKLSKMIRKLKPFDSKALRKYIRKIEPDMILEQEVKCPKCRWAEVQPMPLGTEFFWPQFDE